MRGCTRRGALRASGVWVLGVLAGCSVRSIGSGTPEPQTFEQLDVTSVYVADDVDLSLPPSVPSVEHRHNARLLVLPGDTDADAEQVVEWFADDRILALLGVDAQATWTSWVRSDAVTEHFKVQGYAEAEPTPSLVVGAKLGLYLKTYRRSWGEEPSDRDILRALDDTLVAIQDETPPG